MGPVGARLPLLGSMLTPMALAPVKLVRRATSWVSLFERAKRPIP